MCLGPIYQSRAPLLQVQKIASRPSWQVGRQLAMIGDDINARYQPPFFQLMAAMTPDTACGSLSGAVRKWFQYGETIDWGRIITLLCFGCRMAANTLQRGVRGFSHNIVGFVCQCIVEERIAKWIAEQGGWSAVLNYLPDPAGWPSIGLVVSIAALSIFTVFQPGRR